MGCDPKVVESLPLFPFCVGVYVSGGRRRARELDRLGDRRRELIRS